MWTNIFITHHSRILDTLRKILKRHDYRCWMLKYICALWVWINVKSFSSELFYRGTCRPVAPFAPLIESHTRSQPHTPPPPPSPQQFVCLCATASYGTACPAVLSVLVVSCVVKKKRKEKKKSAFWLFNNVLGQMLQSMTFLCLDNYDIVVCHKYILCLLSRMSYYNI